LAGVALVTPCARRIEHSKAVLVRRQRNIWFSHLSFVEMNLSLTT
jgi:hypothetical protein